MQENAVHVLLEAQQSLNEWAMALAGEYDQPLDVNDFRSRLLFADLGNGLDLEYYGDVWADGDEGPWAIVLKTLSNPAVASRLTSLRITGSDQGANGSRTHDFSELIDRQPGFPNLVEFYVRPTGVSDHNFVDIEAMQIAPLLKMCPNLVALTLPQAPEADFFDLQFDHLRYLRIGMAWCTHGFIRNMAEHRNMPTLRVFDFADSLSVFQKAREAQTPPATLPSAMDEGTKDLMRKPGYGDETLAEMDSVIERTKADLARNPPSAFDDRMTSFEDFCALIQSPSIRENMVVHLRNLGLSESEIRQLNQLKKVQLSLSIEAPHVYVSHWDGKFETAYRHMIVNS